MTARTKPDTRIKFALAKMRIAQRLLKEARIELQYAVEAATTTKNDARPSPSVLVTGRRKDTA